MTKKNIPTLRTLALNRLVEVVVVILMIIGHVWLWSQVVEERNAMYEQQRQIEEAPQRAAQQVALGSQLELFQHDINRIQNLLLQRSAVGSFVGVIEQQGRLHGVRLTVPDIVEEKVRGENGQEVVKASSFPEVRFTVLASGDPIQLVQLLHALEHLPYVIRLANWNISTNPAVVPAELRQEVPAAVDAAVSTPVAAGYLEADLIVTLYEAENN